MNRHKKVSAYVGIGSNLDDSVRLVQESIEFLHESEHCCVRAKSALYRSEPWGFHDQPQFINAVCRIGTTLKPNELLDNLLQIEAQLGRVRGGMRFGPRRIDLDLLLYGKLSMNSENLTLPHPRMHERRFVLEPLVEIDMNIEIPGKGRAVDLLLECQDQGLETLDQ